MTQNSPELTAVVEKLVENGAVYVAANERSLSTEPAQLYYHLPAGTPDDQKEAIHAYLDETVGHRPTAGGLGAIQIADREVPARINHVLHDDLHLYRRVPVYVGEDVAGLDPVTSAVGVAKVRDVVSGATDPDPRPAETVALEVLVAELAEAGAASVEVAHEQLVIGKPEMHLRIPMVPAEGKPIVGPVESVEVDGETYPLRTTLTLSGPYGSGGDWTALYVSDSVAGLKPVPVETGLENGRELLAKVDTADTMQDLMSD